ncbi:Tim10/DDP family zinc finger-domain-containing protein [Rostrohypoxylon terebratum]|nr:Tim10/DDP family zinc finger-domain-containing protein [Rostrohypoxylon terebratum]
MENEAFLQEAKRQIQHQHALDNAKELIDKINKNCFEKCITNPGASFSNTEQNCATLCMEKYSNAWTAVSFAFVNRIQRDRSYGAIKITEA